MLLKEIQVGRRCVVERIELPFQIQRRLEALGMTRRAQVAVVNRKGDGICPMEEAVEGIDDPSAAIAAIKEKLQVMTGSAA